MSIFTLQSLQKSFPNQECTHRPTQKKTHTNYHQLTSDPAAACNSKLRDSIHSRNTAPHTGKRKQKKHEEHQRGNGPWRKSYDALSALSKYLDTPITRKKWYIINLKRFLTFFVDPPKNEQKGQVEIQFLPKLEIPRMYHSFPAHSSTQVSMQEGN